MPYFTTLAEDARKAGLTVVEVDGWQTRGSSTFTPQGLVCHHTADGTTGDIPSLRVLINGRSDLPGPLCNDGLGRSGTVYIVAAGKANHAGAGSWKGLSGNAKVFGIEAENNGSQSWPQKQLDAYYALVACRLKSIGKSADWCCGHKEWAPGRKPDPHTLNMNDFRQRVKLIMEKPNPGPVEPPPVPVPEEDDMPILFKSKDPADHGKVYMLMGTNKVWIPDGNQFNAAKLDWSTILELEPGHFYLKLPELDLGFPQP